jgi:hypothetical protein
MNDNTIIRIKVPAHLYESVKAKLMIKENFEAPVKEEQEAELDENALLDAGLIASGIAALGLSPLVVDKFWDYVKKKNPEAYKKAAGISGAIDKSMGGNRPGQGHGAENGHFGLEEILREAKKEDAKKVAADKKKKEADDKKKAEDKKKKEAEAKKKVAEKKK